MRPQSFLHWLEMGRGASAIRLAALLAGTVALSLLIAWKQFHGPETEAALEQADIGRQLASGQGFTTLVNHPQTAAVLEVRGRSFDPRRPYPALHHAPLYPALIGAALVILPETTREALFSVPAQVSDGYGGDYALLALNLGLLWLAAGLTFRLARGLFDTRAAWVATLALLVSLPLWQHTLRLNGTPLPMVLALATFLVWHHLDGRLRPAEADATTAGARLTAGTSGWVAALGVLTGLLFLTDYVAGALACVAIGYVAATLRGGSRWIALAVLAGGFAVVTGPWMVRNVTLTGSPIGLSGQEVALKAGDTTAEPASFRASFSAEPARLNLRKLGNKVLTTVQHTFQSRFWAGGAMWFLAFFVAGLLYGFRSPGVNRMRWLVALSVAVLLLAQAAFDAGDTDRPVVVWIAPLVMIFGAGFFFVLLGSNARLSAWPKAAAALLLAVQALPLVHDALAPPPGVRFQYPPYFPALLRGMRTELEGRRVEDRFGAMADIPAGVAWYGRVRCWTQPPQLRDFYAISLHQPIGELLLTPRTLDRPFFSELNARSVAPGSLGTVANRFGEWGEIYAGLVTGTMPREFPLKAPHKVAENLFVLLNPALPPPRGK